MHSVARGISELLFFLKCTHDSPLPSFPKYSRLKLLGRKRPKNIPSSSYCTCPAWNGFGAVTTRAAAKKKIFPNFEAAAAVKNLLRLEKRGEDRGSDLKKLFTVLCVAACVWRVLHWEGDDEVGEEEEILFSWAPAKSSLPLFNDCKLIISFPALILLATSTATHTYVHMKKRRQPPPRVKEERRNVSHHFLFLSLSCR